MPVWQWVWLYPSTKESMKALASGREPKRSGNVGANFSDLNQASLYGLSLLTRGREWDRVTSRSESSAATVLDVIEVPRSAWTICGMPWIPKISFIISTASSPDSWASVSYTHLTLP